jgi:TonB-dependent receptor
VTSIPVPRALLASLVLSAVAAGQQAGSIRGTVFDQDFDVPVAGATVTIFGTNAVETTSEGGAYSFREVAPGSYTLVFAKDGYVRQVKADVVVTAGKLTDLDVWLVGEFTEMEEFVVEDILQDAAGSEAALIAMRFENPALMDSIGSELMSKAGASDAAGALRLVAGASVQDGKTAVIRGLPDRYVSSQVNSVRLPSADEDKRALELDQFPAAVIESVQVSKTFTPDQQGDASGGAVNLRLRGIPEQTVLQFKSQLGYNSQAGFNDDFLGYEGNGFDFFGNDDQGRNIQPDGNWAGAVGTSEEDAPIDYKLGLDAGTKTQLSEGVEVGGFLSLFYERDSTFIEGKDDSLWRVNPGDPLSPEFGQGTPEQESQRTSLFDVTQASQSVKWGGLATLGLETENHSLGLTYLYTRSAEDKATLSIDTRGKEYYYPGHDPNDPSSPGSSALDAAPYIRSETLDYTQRTTDTIQLHGTHVLPSDGFDLGSSFRFSAPELDWTAAYSSAEKVQPDKRQFTAIWQPFGTGLWSPYKPAASFQLGNLQRTFKELEEEGDQYLLNLKLPFEQWSGEEGYVKLGFFDDSVERAFDQESFSNFNENGSFFGGFDDPWSGVFPDEDHPISDGPPFQDVDYEGQQDVRAFYGMVDLPVSEPLSFIAGLRFESTDISTIVDPEADALWLNPDSTTNAPEDLLPGEGNASFSQDDVLPAFAFTYQPLREVTFRGAYTETIARQTFKELTPILQQEYLGAPIFVGNPELEMASLKNYDLRVDYAPREGSFLSLSWFYKDLTDPIEYVQNVFTFTFTQPTNYPKGKMSGYEVEVREDMERYFDGLEGLSVGANATFMDSEVTLPADEFAILQAQGETEHTRDATNAPEYLYNLYFTYDLDGGDTQLGVFYTVQGDTLLTGAGAAGNTTFFVPTVYQEDFGTLNLSLSRRISEHFRLQFQAKNLTNPDIKTVYRSDQIGSDVTKSSYTAGREFSITLSASL